MPIKKGMPVSKVETAVPKEKRKKKRKKHRGAFMAIIFVLLIIAVLLTSVTLFFTVKKITVTGDSIYTEDEIKSVAGIELESNMFSINKFLVIKKLESVLPYIEEATIKRDLPNTVIIHVTAAKNSAFVETTGGYVLLSTKGKVLENTLKLPEIMQLIGSGIAQNTVGETAEFSDDLRFSLYIELMSRFESMGVRDKITMLNIGRMSNIAFEYEGRVLVNLGTNKDFDRKMNFFKYILEKNPTAAHATMDLSETETNKATYSGEIPESEYLSQKQTLMSENEAEDPDLSSAYVSGTNGKP